MPKSRIWQGCKYARVTQGPEYARISLTMPYQCVNMTEYALITLNMIEHADIYLKKQNAEYAISILNMSDVVHCFIIYCAVTETETYPEHCQTFNSFITEAVII